MAAAFQRHASIGLERNSPEYQSNLKDWERVLEQYEVSQEDIVFEGQSQQQQRHRDRGMLLARDRVALLLDPDSPFLELCAYAGYKLPNGSIAGTLVAGIGLVSECMCMIMAHIPTLSGGSWTPATVQKQSRILEIASQNKLPLISLVHSAGVFLPSQFDVFHPGGTLFKRLAQRSQAGEPNCAIVFGSSTAGGAYHPGMSDYTIFIEGQAMTALGGSALVQMATGEVVQNEELGGARMHSEVSGLSDQLALDEFDGILRARRWAATLNILPKTIIRSVRPPHYAMDDMFGFISTDIRKPFNMIEIIARIVDDSRMEVFKPLYGKNLITTWAHIHGHLVGIIANQVPVFFVPEAQKGTQFIKLCNAQNTPIIFLHNVTGFMVGRKTEREGLIKAGSQFVNAVSNSCVPHISIICGASYGAGNYAMCGRSYDPRFLFSWPIGRCSVMGPDQLSGVMTYIAREAAANSGRKVDEEAIEKRSETFKTSVNTQSTSYYTSAHLLDDGIIDPRDTRDVLGMCLDVVTNTPIAGREGFRGVSRL